MGGPKTERGPKKMLSVSADPAPAYHPEAAVTLPCTPGNTTPGEAYLTLNVLGNYLLLILTLICSLQVGK